MLLEAHIRKLARSNYWQEIYNSSKTCSGIYLFKNQTNFSGIQYLFLYWLRVYAMIYSELSQSEWENLDEKVIENNDRFDAFMYWRSKHIEKQIRKQKSEDKKSNQKPGMLNVPIYTGKNNKEGDK